MSLNQRRHLYLSEQFTPLLDSLEFGQQITTPPRNELIQNELKLPAVTRNKRKVFIVHGRNNEAKQEVSRFIEKLGLEAVKNLRQSRRLENVNRSKRVNLWTT